MKCRQVTFFVENPDLVPMMEAVRDRVIPSYESFPHFQGVTVVRNDLGPRSEVVVTSFWDDGLEQSEELSNQFVQEIAHATGRNPIRKPYETLYAQVRNSLGGFGIGGLRWEGRPRKAPKGSGVHGRNGVAPSGSSSAK
jgi:heme-degrading monooxygenase HmoA